MRTHNYKYLMVLTGLILPGLLVTILPRYAALIRVLAAAIILTAVSVACMLTVRPLIDHLRGEKLMQFSMDRGKMIFYTLLRGALLLVGLYFLIVFVIPTWLGAFDVYILRKEPSVISGVIDRQGSGLSFAPLASTLQVQGQSTDLIWFYGYYLQLNQHYMLTTLPQSNIVMDVAND